MLIAIGFTLFVLAFIAYGFYRKRKSDAIRKKAQNCPKILSVKYTYKRD